MDKVHYLRVTETRPSGRHSRRAIRAALAHVDVGDIVFTGVPHKSAHAVVERVDAPLPVVQLQQRERQVLQSVCMLCPEGKAPEDTGASASQIWRHLRRRRIHVQEVSVSQYLTRLRRAGYLSFRREAVYQSSTLWFPTAAGVSLINASKN